MSSLRRRLPRATRIQLGSITLFFGELFARGKSIATRGGGQVVTNELSASVEGTEYGVRRDLPAADAALGRVQVYVREGHVRYAPGAGAYWSPLTITVNPAFEVAGYRAAPAARTVDAWALSRWADDAERRLKQKAKRKFTPALRCRSAPRRRTKRRASSLTETAAETTDRDRKNGAAGPRMSVFDDTENRHEARP